MANPRKSVQCFNIIDLLVEYSCLDLLNVIQICRSGAMRLLNALPHPRPLMLILLLTFSFPITQAVAATAAHARARCFGIWHLLFDYLHVILYATNISPVGVEEICSCIPIN